MLKILFQTAGVGTRMFVYLAFKMSKRHSELPLINFSTHMKKKCASFALVSDQRKNREHGVSLVYMSTRMDNWSSSGDKRTAYLRSNSNILRASFNRLFKSNHVPRKLRKLHFIGKLLVIQRRNLINSLKR